MHTDYQKLDCPSSRNARSSFSEEMYPRNADSCRLAPEKHRRIRVDSARYEESLRHIKIQSGMKKNTGSLEGILVFLWLVTQAQIQGREVTHAVLLVAEQWLSYMSTCKCQRKISVCLPFKCV